MNPCEPNPCQNGGVCIRNSKIGFICKCKHGYHGDHGDVNSVPTLKPNSSNECNITVNEDATNTESIRRVLLEHTDLVSCCSVIYYLVEVPVPVPVFWIGCFGTFIILVSVIIIAAVLYVCLTKKKYQIKQSKSNPEDEDLESNCTKVDLDKQPLLDQN